MNIPPWKFFLVLKVSEVSNFKMFQLKCRKYVLKKYFNVGYLMMTQGGINGVSIIFLCGTIPEISNFEMFQLKRKKGGTY